MIQLENIGIQFGDRALFENLSLNLTRGNRYGVVGANGSGKTTFLNMLGGGQTPTTGEIRKSSSLKLGVLKQNQYDYEGCRILDVVLMGNHKLWSLIEEKKSIMQRSDLSAEDGKRLANLEHEISEIDGYNAEGQAAIILKGLGIQQHLLDRTMSVLSGGYKLRVLIGQCLFSNPDVLLLDEPNNHLDIFSIAWLGEFLKDYKGIVIVVSHDQFFLNQISNRILDIDYETIKIYTGDYDNFLIEKRREAEQRQLENERLEKKRQELQAFYERFRAKATKARQAVSRKKQIDKMEDIVIIRSSRISPRFNFTQMRPSGEQVLDVKGLKKSFSNLEVLKNVNFSTNRSDRIAVIGPNGVGKSTLIKVLAGLIPYDEGKIIWGHECHVGYFAQNHKELIPPGTNVYDWLYSNTPNEKVTTIRTVLGQVLFSGDDTLKKTDVLSGGEAARLVFALLMLKQHNILLLDEPTNHLDLEAIEALITALTEFPGTIIFVSHNRFFVNQLATAVLELTFDGYTFYPGNYDDYLARQQEDYLNRDIRTRIKQSERIKIRSSFSGGKQLLRERRELSKELSRLEKKLRQREESITQLEEKIDSLDRIFSSSDIYDTGRQEEFQQSYKEQQRLKTLLEAEFEMWERDHNQLDEIRNRIDNIDN
ncbi:MAG: ATP-binding cassette domain-containing protein [Candidatus Marinimicrobia bacterium]|nr:ATP-binding cassette domain-containing protein [Candidatus Neomarinimicrobiota bacterium]